MVLSTPKVRPSSKGKSRRKREGFWDGAVRHGRAALTDLRHLNPPKIVESIIVRAVGGSCRRMVEPRVQKELLGDRGGAKIGGAVPHGRSANTIVSIVG